MPQWVTESWEQTSTSGIEGLQTPPSALMFSESRHGGVDGQSLARQRSEHWAERGLLALVEIIPVARCVGKPRGSD